MCSSDLFEESCGLVEKFIAQAEAHAVQMDELANETEANASGVLWVRHGRYVGRKYGLAVSVDEWYAITEWTTKTYAPGQDIEWTAISHYANPITGRTENLVGLYGADNRSVSNQLAACAKKRAAAYRNAAAASRQYAEWQRERIAGWKPGERLRAV